MKTLLNISLVFFAATGFAFSQGASDYFPAHIGDYWIMHTDTMMGEYRPTAFRKEFDKIDLILGDEYFRSQQIWAADNGSSTDTIYVWGRENSLGIVIGAFGSKPNIDSATIYNPPLLLFPNELVNPGHTWDFDWPEGGGHYANSVESISETVEVPAGTFNDCIKIRRLVTNATGDTMRMDNTYLAQNVGEILSATFFPANSIYNLELMEYFIVTSTGDEGIPGTPANFKLQQNYPNPFNPTTKINYQIPERVFVTLKVYDVLGNEVATLVNENQPSGVYKIEFDGNELTSGIYIYKLQTGDPSTNSGQSFMDIKKMILLK